MRSYKAVVAPSEITLMLSFMKIGHMAEKFVVESAVSLSPLFSIFKEEVWSKLSAMHLDGACNTYGRRGEVHTEWGNLRRKDY
jgi:hypothetical protein